MLLGIICHVYVRDRQSQQQNVTLDVSYFIIR